MQRSEFPLYDRLFKNIPPPSEREFGSLEYGESEGLPHPPPPSSGVTE